MNVGHVAVVPWVGIVPGQSGSAAISSQVHPQASVNAEAAETDALPKGDAMCALDEGCMIYL